MAIMLLSFLLLLINSFMGLSGAEHETLCTSKACFTLHMDKVNFEKAHQNCVDNGGNLMTVRGREEEDVLRSLLSQIQRRQGFKFWIGLKLQSGDCVLAHETLRGFKWVSGEKDSHYSNWEREPVDTCIEKCVKITYTSGQNQLKWTDGNCRGPVSYACKFYFQGMCKPLALLGPGKITYIAPFSQEPQRSEMTLFPLGTYADISCNGKQLTPYSVCTGVDHWTTPGPFCKTGKQNCVINNGGCEHLCHMDADRVRCSCKNGYDLDNDGVSCRIRNLCGINTCEHQCVMGESGYSCKCPDGFKLNANQRNCSDIDECQSQICLDNFCVNTHGSYKCECSDGYKMIDGKCIDVDECMHSRCQHSCLNSVGSFSCYCKEGFTLSQDGHSCVDTNECINSDCHFKCINTVGSFLCTCPLGFHLDTNGKNCNPDVIVSSSNADEETQENFTESLIRTTIELQHQSPHTDTPLPELVNVTHGDHQSNASLTTSPAKTVNTRVIICVLGSVIPLLFLLAVTVAIAICRCSRSKKEAKKNTTTDGYCWVSSGLDPRLEKLYESILTDDL
ncbi:complement component C1q receptor [Scomber scombrus]|uniref:Complement component C1q receptor n=1 Tax=Scomber scombrus TaxID=13677 RepID=A0AAV1P896_SCOSC|nr:complement component C1q receptor [Scomber scombrus]